MLKSTFLLLSTFLLWSATAQAQATYYWRGASDAWSAAGTWSTEPTAAVTTTNRRNTASDNDIMVFDGNARNPANTGAVVFPPRIVVDFGNGQASDEQVIGQLRIVNNANVILSGPTNNNVGSILTIGGSGIPLTTAGDLFLQAGSSVTFSTSGQTDNRFLLMRLGTGKKGLVSGNMVFNAGTNIPSRLVAADVGSLVFSSGSTFKANAMKGSPFGTTGTNTLVNPNNGNALPEGFIDNTKANSVVFQNGATFEQRDGTTPFSTGPSPITSFLPASSYIYINGIFSAVGQTYGNLLFIGGTTATTVGGDLQQMKVVNDLTMTSGTLNLNLTGTGTGTAAPISLGGNLIINGGTLKFSPPNTSTSTVAFNNLVSTSSTAIKQSIGGVGVGSPEFNSPIILEINNEGGLLLERPVTVGGGLRLTRGLISTNATNLLTLPSTASIFDGSSSNNSGVGGSFVDGPVARITTGAVSNLLFPVGKVSAARTGAPNGLKIYRPMTLEIINQTSTTTYTAEQMETPTHPAQNLGTSGLTRVSYQRYFTLTPTTAPSGFNGRVTLTFGLDDYVNYPAATSFVIAKRDLPAAWTNIGRFLNSGTSNGGLPVIGTLTSATFTSFSDFALASTAPASNNAFNTINPLPVELTRFAATTQGQSVNVNWATASEKNSDRFEIQRSATGGAFETVGTVKGQGNTSSAHNYSFVDSRPLAGRSYYRLRQVDIDGTIAYSPVAAVQVRNELAVYPNPSTGIVTLPSTLGDVHYRLLNTIGQTLLSGQATGNDQLDLTKLAKGTFFLELTGEAGRTTQRLVRE